MPGLGLELHVAYCVGVKRERRSKLRVMFMVMVRMRDRHMIPHGAVDVYPTSLSLSLSLRTWYTCAIPPIAHKPLCEPFPSTAREIIQVRRRVRGPSPSTAREVITTMLTG